MKKLRSKIFITGLIVSKTGMHIGGSKSALDIGGIDLNVIKNGHGIPFIPGSSLKGKLRSLSARLVGSIAISSNDVSKEYKAKYPQDEYITDENFPYMYQLFGSSGDNEDKGEVTRLLVRDAYLDTTHFAQHFNNNEMELEYTDVKWENTVDRIVGSAKNPRQLERVPAGVQFDFEIVLDDYDDGKTDSLLAHIRTAMHLLQDDYIGGNGSRGYGRIEFKDVQFTQKTIANYNNLDERQNYDFQFYSNKTNNESSHS